VSARAGTQSSNRYWVGGAMLAIVIGLIVAVPNFASPSNLLEVLRQASILGIMALGVTFVVVAGRLDLSVGALLSACALVTIEVCNAAGPVAAISAALALGLAIGAVNGFLVARLRLNSLVATLGMMSLIGGLALVQTSGQTAFVANPDDGWFRLLGRGMVLGIPVPVVALAIVALLSHVALAHSAWGRRVQAVGGNETAAAYSGIRTRLVMATTYVVAGGFTALAAILFASRVMAAQTDSGVDMEILVMAGIVLGGTSLAGGSGSALRTLGGVLFLAVIQNALLLLGLPYAWQWLFSWGAIVAAIWADAAAGRGRLLA
jgi:ribose/xylose/arabinose/galactoside ABC-type transport system permease subunit